MAENSNEVCVIVPAWNAEATLERAVVSAMIQPEVREIVIVDDASTDSTLSVARDLADRDSRVKVFGQKVNRGPAASRNLGIANTRSQVIALLDSDDFFRENRFAKMLGVFEWDALADNIAFVRDNKIPDFSECTDAQPVELTKKLSFSDFIESNISKRAKYRGELGFAKPLLRRAFLERAGICYDERLRLGEDYALYARLIAHGGRFLTIAHSGYVAVERPASLSGHHALSDLDALALSDAELETLPALNKAERSLVRKHRSHVEARAYHRRFLRCKRERGTAQALWSAAKEPDRLPGLALAIFADKFYTPVKPSQDIRYLF